ncbi:kinase-like protein [Sporormia fimetaria CBS 119925]|uniref:Kinase-like protein n=1 Tax=Sporormia fimetaria CBS 119925 TaxID=1340428 RepID=A0A6A6VM92_9PLEO|nr:kinase-like protein [Sporormia fimetaria CBS 119925]
MRLVRQHLPHIPVPEVYDASYGGGQGGMTMAAIPGTTLDKVWDKLADETKRKVYETSWSYIEQWRSIPRPADVPNICLCTADGRYSESILVSAPDDDTKGLWTDEDVRNRIYERYLSSIPEPKPDLLEGLPRAQTSVFTHADIAPRNIMFDPETQLITGVIDWEYAGWYPDYWEYATIFMDSGDWQDWMRVTVPSLISRPDLAALKKIRWTFLW